MLSRNKEVQDDSAIVLPSDHKHIGVVRESMLARKQWYSRPGSAPLAPRRPPVEKIEMPSSTAEQCKRSASASRRTWNGAALGVGRTGIAMLIDGERRGRDAGRPAGSAPRELDTRPDPAGEADRSPSQEHRQAGKQQHPDPAVMIIGHTQQPRLDNY